MRVKKLLGQDVTFQYKYGFYFIYVVLVFFFLFIIHIVPEQWTKKVAIAIIYADPTALGLFFIGALVLLEKSQRVLNTLAVSPVRIWEYIVAKLGSLALIGMLVGSILAVYAQVGHYPMVILGILAGSILFSLFGLIVAVEIKSLNQFIIATVPIELLMVLPGIIYVFGYQPSILTYHPGVICIGMVMGKTNLFSIETIVLILWIIILFIFTNKTVKQSFRRLGGISL